MNEKKKASSFIFSSIVFILWWGGFTFYAAFVVPVGMQILGSHILMGFVTEEVTLRLDIIGVIAILFGFISSKIFKNEIRPKKWVIANLVLMLILLIFLFILHSIMDTYLDFDSRKLSEEHHFYQLHRVYLLTSTVMWIQGLIHICCLLQYNLRKGDDI